MTIFKSYPRSALVLLAFSLVSYARISNASESTSTAYLDPELRYTELHRISILGGAGTTMGTPPDNTDGSPAKMQTIGVSALIDFGHGTWTFQTGLSYIAVPLVITGVVGGASGAGDQTTTVDGSYIGIPLEVKYNYFEHPMAVFSLKAGIMPAYLVSPTDAAHYFGDPHDPATPVASIKNFDAMLLAGFTGCGPINDDVGFLIDATVFYGLIEVDGFTRNEGVLLSAGFTFSL